MENYINNEKTIIRRKAKRIERAQRKLSYLRSDINDSESLNQEEKTYLLDQIKEINLYLQNDDLEENKYNFDNANN